MIVTVALIGVAAPASLALYFYARFFRHAAGMRLRTGNGLPEHAPAMAPVSILICAHNEAGNLRSNLPSVLEQHYPDAAGEPAFELIVVDDRSSDDTGTVLHMLQQRYDHLRVVRIGPDARRALPGKKFPLSQGLAVARHPVIVCTDADCRPASASWLKLMAAPLAGGASIVAGYGGYYRHPGALNRFIRLETMQTFALYFCFWKGGVPYMAVGRNLAARSELFLRAQEAPQWAALPSGDDDLLIQLCATQDNMVVISDPDSFTWSEPERTTDAYLAQKRRHVSAGKYYRLPAKVHIALFALMQLLSFMAPAWLLVYLMQSAAAPPAQILVIGLCALPLLTFRSLQHTGRQLGDPAGLSGWIVFSFCWLLYNTVLAPWILWKTKQRWK